MPTDAGAKLPGIYFTVATAGHVDHGKTSLIKALTGINPDRLKEEQERQMTTDLGFAHLHLLKGDLDIGLGFIDVPGHGKFIKNMLAGVGGIAMALLVVAADEGPMPQTVQHVKILSLLGVRQAVVALTKIDVVDKDRVRAVEARVRNLLERFAIEACGVVPVSAVTLEGVEVLKLCLGDVVASVHERQALAPASTLAAQGEKPGYMPIDRVFAKSGYGTVVTGTLVEGKFKIGDQVIVQPGAIAARVRGLETYGQKREDAGAGQRLAINLSLKDNKAVLSRGLCVLAGNKNITSDLLVQITDYTEYSSSDSGQAGPGEGKTLLEARPVKLYHGTMEMAGYLRWTENSEGNLFGYINLEEPVVASPGDRYVIRFGEEGIAGGAILLCQKPRWLTRKVINELAPLLFQADKREAKATFLLEHHPARAVPFAQFGWAIREEEQAACLKALEQTGSAVQLSGFVMGKNAREAIKTKILNALNLLLKGDDKAITGVNLETVRKMASGNVERAVMLDLIKELAGEGKLVRQEDKLFGPGGAAITAELDAYTDKILKLLDNVLCLELAEIGRQSNSDAKQVKLAVDRLAKMKMAYVVDYEFASSQKWIDFAHQKLWSIWQAKKDISPADFRDELGTTRKYALALLAYFDHQSITKRTNSGRALLKSPKS